MPVSRPADFVTLPTSTRPDSKGPQDILQARPRVVGSPTITVPTKSKNQKIKKSILPLLICITTLSCADVTLDPIQASSLDTLQRLNRGALDDVRAHLYQHAPGELAPIYLKIPFQVSSRGVGQEWMWIQVVQWSPEGEIEGILVDQPRRVAGLRPGAYIRFHIDDVADYHERLDDGSYHGNALQALVHGDLGLPKPTEGGSIRDPE